jgi:hypothetical protein
MVPIIHFKHLTCDGEIAISPVEQRVVCPNCRQPIEVFPDVQLIHGGPISTCVACGHDAFYVQKDFNRRLGMAIVGIGIAVSVFFFARNEPMYAMAALAATALVDFLAYVLVGDVTVCYSCHALYRGFRRNPEHEAFDLKKLEKYGGRTPRT